MNHELAELYGEPSILTVVKAGRIRWMGHVMKILKLCPTTAVFGKNAQNGMRRRGAQDQVKRDLMEIECLHGWEAAARDRASWRIIVDRAMSHRCALS